MIDDLSLFESARLHPLHESDHKGGPLRVVPVEVLRLLFRWNNIVSRELEVELEVKREI
jgi:hypothetical protein